MSKNNNKMNKNKIEDSISNIIYNVLVVTLLWIAISSFIQRFKCPSMTETELFLHIPKSVVCDWEYCSNNLFKYQNNNESKRDY